MMIPFLGQNQNRFFDFILISFLSGYAGGAKKSRPGARPHKKTAFPSGKTVRSDFKV
jgi:hypothetical protein